MIGLKNTINWMIRTATTASCGGFSCLAEPNTEFTYLPEFVLAREEYNLYT
jgi:hypothetical protein